MNTEALTGLFAAAAAKGAGRLTESTGGLWKVDKIALSEDAAFPFRTELAGTVKDQYGSHFSIPGATFLVLFPSQSGFVVSASFTRDHENSFNRVTDVVLKSLAEVANILLNPFVGHLAAAWRTPIIISAPKMQAASQRELMASALERFKAQGALAAAYHIKLASPDLFSECSVVVLLDASFAGMSA